MGIVECMQVNRQISESIRIIRDFHWPDHHFLQKIADNEIFVIACGILFDCCIFHFLFQIATTSVIAAFENNLLKIDLLFSD